MNNYLKNIQEYNRIQPSNIPKVRYSDIAINLFNFNLFNLFSLISHVGITNLRNIDM